MSYTMLSDDLKAVFPADLLITTDEHAMRILDMSDIARESGLRLTVRDRELERTAYNRCSRNRHLRVVGAK
jgi:hypothetical protein